MHEGTEEGAGLMYIAWFPQPYSPPTGPMVYVYIPMDRGSIRVRVTEMVKPAGTKHKSLPHPLRSLENPQVTPVTLP